MTKPSHHYSCARRVQTTSIYLVLLHLSHHQYLRDLKVLCCVSHLSVTLHTSTLPSSSQLSPTFPCPQPSLARSHYHIPTHFERKSCIFSPLTSGKPLSKSNWV